MRRPGNPEHQGPRHSSVIFEVEVALGSADENSFLFPSNSLSSYPSKSHLAPSVIQIITGSDFRKSVAQTMHVVVFSLSRPLANKHQRKTTFHPRVLGHHDSQDGGEDFSPNHFPLFKFQYANSCDTITTSKKKKNSTRQINLSSLHSDRRLDAAIVKVAKVSLNSDPGPPYARPYPDSRSPPRSATKTRETESAADP